MVEKKKLSDKKLKSMKCVKQAQGTLSKVTEMIENGRYCPEVMQQIDSAIGLLRTTKRELLAGHLDTCVAHQMAEDKQKAVNELLKIYNLSN